jgi:transcription elongation factor Elf1
MSHPNAEYDTIELDRARCPECGHEKIAKTEAANRYAQPVPPQYQATCENCEHTDDPHAFHDAYELHRMTDAERQEALKQSEIARDRMAAWQESAAYYAEQREP